MNILVLRALNRTERQKLRPHRVFEIPSFRILPLKNKIPSETYDYVLVTSANALAFVRRMPVATTWVAIGKSTESALRRRRVVTLRESHSEGVLKYFRKAKRGRILFPRSSLGDPQLARDLRSLGFTVRVVHTYQTKILQIRRPLMKLFREQKLDSIFVTSPSSFKALQLSLSRAELLSLNLLWIVIGPTSAKVMRDFGLKFQVAKSPSLESMKKTVSRLFTKRS